MRNCCQTTGNAINIKIHVYNNYYCSLLIGHRGSIWLRGSTGLFSTLPADVPLPGDSASTKHTKMY